MTDRTMWLIIAGGAFGVLWRDRILLAVLVLVTPGSWLKQALRKYFEKGGAK
jgi:hypothetical protein